MSHEQLHRVCDRDEWKCSYCGRELFCRACEPERLYAKGQAIWATRDHVLPRSRGGWSTLDNLVASCPPCNQRKGDTIPPWCAPKKPAPKPAPRPARRGLTHRAVIPLRALELLHSLDCLVMSFAALNPGTPVSDAMPCTCATSTAAEVG